MAEPDDQHRSDRSPSHRPRARPEPSPWLVATAGMELAGAVAILTLIGWWLDSQWSTRPWLTLTGALLGMVVGFHNLWRTCRRYFD